MEIITFLIGLIVGAVGMFFIYRNNKKTFAKKEEEFKKTFEEKEKEFDNLRKRYADRIDKLKKKIKNNADL